MTLSKKKNPMADNVTSDPSATSAPQTELLVRQYNTTNIRSMFRAPLQKVQVKHR